MVDASRKNPLGPTGVVAARRVRELRESHGWTYQELSRRLAENGRPIPPLGLRRIEAEDRRIDADDLVALAICLGVNPSAVLLPVQGRSTVEITAVGEVPVAQAWGWADGGFPLKGAASRAADEPDPDGVALADFYDYGRPGFSVAYMLQLLDTKEGRRRFAARVERLPEWVVERHGDEVVKIVMPTRGGSKVLWPDTDRGEDDGR